MERPEDVYRLQTMKRDKLKGSYREEIINSKVLFPERTEWNRIMNKDWS